MHWNRRVIAIFLLFYALFVQLCISDDECKKGTDTECKSKPKSDHESEKYTKASNTKWKKYLMKIDQAVLEYHECNPDDCSCHESVINSDLAVWEYKEKGITKEKFNEAKTRGLGTHYQIINHKLYREENCMFPARCSGVEHFLLEIIKKLPDMELILNTRDWPQSPKYSNPLPVFSFSKVVDENWDIMYPAWTFWEESFICRKEKEWPWDKKIPKGFFRGSRTSSERDPLIRLSRAEPELVDAEYTKNQAWKSDAIFIQL
ncbi:hypothetical protein KUTeg_020369 [Tegillarca granosa]|uniref:Glycosyl transferase CAP10 domain-containing protein n=1 Tax=Tegillarca granosa TaxID=220873 RepID=A0ABQ9EBW6_TEGGR|nr:hypothetical protein KUTeg_020369 [Tegillarca granosa]